MSLICVKNQPLETDGNGKTTLEKWGKDPPDVTLNVIAKDLLSYFKKNEHLSEKIEKKYNIKNEHDDCWPEDDIKRAWGKTQRMDIKSEKRKNWAHVIMLQMFKRRLVYDECKHNSAQEDHDNKADDINQAFETTPRLEENSEDTSQSNDELPIRRVAREVEPPFAAGLKTSKYKLLEEFGALSESRLSASSSDESLSLAESRGKKCHTNSNSSETKNAALVNESKDTLVNNCEKREIDNHEESSFTDTPDQIKAEKENRRRDEPIYIRIPLSEFDDELTITEGVPNVISHYKLINGFPSNNDIRHRKDYVVSYNNETYNAKWVYEILNTSTSAKNAQRPESYRSDYQQGHLAAAANHKWCQEALNDASLLINIAPQHKDLNTRIWKTLEYYCRRMAQKRVIRNVHVYTGPLYIYEPDNFAQVNYQFWREKAVPTHFFKVIIVENMDGTVREPECYMMPNDTPQTKDIDRYRVSIEDIERLSGLQFIEHNPALNLMDHRKTVTWQGHNQNGHQLDGIEINVSISSSDIN